MGTKKVQLWVGTRKGGYIAESDARRRQWKVNGPFQPGREVFHIAPDPRRPGAAYAAVNSGFFGPMLFATKDGGRRWKELSLPQVKGPPARPNGAGDKLSAIVNLWHVEPGPSNEPDTLFLGIDPASLHRSDDGGKSWSSVDGLNQHSTRDKWNPGNGGLCLHTILLDPSNPRRMYAGISAAGTFRSDDGGDHWRVMNRGVAVSFRPEHEPEVGQCVHRIALSPEDSKTLYRQDHDGMFVTHDRMETWQNIGRGLPYKFGFVVGATPQAPGGAFYFPVQPESRLTKGGFQVYRWNDRTRKWRTMVAKSPWQGGFGTHREGMAIDALDPFGLYVGTTTGQLIYTPDAGRSWSEIPHQFPSIHSVSVSAG